MAVRNDATAYSFTDFTDRQKIVTIKTLVINVNETDAAFAEMQISGKHSSR